MRGVSECGPTRAETNKAYPFGCGVGNCMKRFPAWRASPMGKIISTMFICRTSSTAAGLAGQRIWRWSSGSSGWKKKLLHDPFVAALFTYCGASLLQFRGGDTLAFLLLGMYRRTGMQTTKKKLGRKNSIR